MCDGEISVRRGRKGIVVLFTVTMLLVSPDPARAILYWDADATTAGNNTATGAGLGGSGSWGSAGNWFNGVSEVTWTGGSDAVFTGTAGVVTLGAPQSASSLAFKSSGYSLTGSTLTVGPTPANYIVDAGVTATIDSTLAGGATMTKSGAGTLVLANANNTNTSTTTEGGWRIDGGILRIAGDGSLGAPLPDTARNTITDIQLNQSTIQFAAPTQIDINRRTKVNTNSSSNLGDAFIDTNGNAVSWFGSIQGGPGSIVVTNSGPSPGILILGTDKKASINPFGSALPGGTVNLTVQNGAIVQTSGQVTPTGGELGSETGAGGAILAIKLDNGQIRSESGGYSFQRNLILGPGGGSLDTGAWDQTFTGTVTGLGALAKFGSGTLTIDNPPAAGWAGGTTIHSGVLQLGRSGSNGLLPGTLANPSSVVIKPAGTLKFVRGSDKSFFDVISGGGQLVVANANNAVVRLVSDNTYTGLTTISSGMLMIGQGNPGNPGSIVSNVLNNSVLDFNRVENITYGGTISGSGSVIKEAAGKLTLSGANSYSGGTNVQAGTLLAGNASGSATGSGPVHVMTGATLGGSGTIGGTVQIDAGAHLAPGNSIGTLNVSNLALAANSQLDFELGAPAFSDLIVITTPAGLNIAGGSVNIAPSNGFGVGQYRLLDYDTAFVGTLANLSIGSAPTGFLYSLIDNSSATSVDLVITVPEPASALLALAAGAFFAARLVDRIHRCRE